MRLWIGALVAMVGVAGCYSVDDVRQRPPAFTGTYSAQFDDLANCISAQSSRNYAVTPQLYQREKRANVILSIPTSGTVAEEYEIRQVTETTSTVTWRNAFVSSPGPSSGNPARELVGRCAAVA